MEIVTCLVRMWERGCAPSTRMDAHAWYGLAGHIVVCGFTRKLLN